MIDFGTLAERSTSSLVTMRRPVGHEPGQRLDPRAGGQDDVARLEHGLAGRSAVRVEQRHAHLLRALEPAAATHVLHAVLLDEAAQALDEASHDLIAARGDHLCVDGDLAHRDAQVGGMADAVVQVCGLEHRLRGDASDVQAGSADAFGAIIDKRNAEAQLPGSECRCIAAGPGSEDDDVVGLGCAGLAGHAGTPVGGSRGGTGCDRW